MKLNKLKSELNTFMNHIHRFQEIHNFQDDLKFPEAQIQGHCAEISEI